ncbi:hypothetical protein IDH50_15865 [Aeromicrobium tamlense]|uniref:Uncharacterized protein n=1 Tax=Aeromicrobium tamlense TaxID=375541 RepID=A0A8I0FZ41_9ACTN|nr:hypothetical protein [Aeromicrobium tamlense]MBD1271721.1 hypothetical protein [Aeromicrobium tamlense]NYI37531.1 hypothetical protein [Aeromicrobium tamlense]
MIGSEVSLDVDDVGVVLSDGGMILIQAKAGLKRLDIRAPDLVSAVDQVISAFREGLPFEPHRLFDVKRDRLIIATTSASSSAFEALSTVCARARFHPAKRPIADVAVNGREEAALSRLLSIVRNRWKVASGGALPEDHELRSLLRVLEFKRYDFDADGIDRTRINQELVTSSHSSPFDRLVAEGIDCATSRSWRSPDAIRSAISMPRATRDAHMDRATLQRLTTQSLGSLSRHTTLPVPEGSITVEREIPSGIAEDPDNLLVVGGPGTGKTGVLAKLAESTRGDKVVLVVDNVPTDRAVATLQWGLSSDLAEVLRGWTGEDPATLYLDGLDAHRTGASWLATVVNELQGTRWRVVATVRRFELLHSPVWRQTFKGTPLSPTDLDPSPVLKDVRHLAIGDFNASELSQVREQSPGVDNFFVATGSSNFVELISNPFNLSLACELLCDLDAASIARFQTRAELLGAYWEERITSGEGALGRIQAVHDLARRMIRSRSLRASIQEIEPQLLEHVEGLLGRGVLVEGARTGRLLPAATLEFAHHVIFDYAVAAAVLAPAGLARVLEEDPNLVVFARPSIDLLIADLWSADPNRETYWDTAIVLVQASKPLAVAAMAIHAIREMTEGNDFRRLVANTNALPEATASIVQHLATAMSALSNEERAQLRQDRLDTIDQLVGAIYAAWASSQSRPNEIAVALARLIWEVRRLSPLPRNGEEAKAHAAAIEGLLSFAQADPAAREWLGARALEAVADSIAMLPGTPAVVGKCLDPPVTQFWGLLPLRPLLSRLGEIAAVDDDLATGIVEAVYSFDATEEKSVSLGGAILSLVESWRQAHEMLYYVIATEGWRDLCIASPRKSVRTLGRVLQNESRETRTFTVCNEHAAGSIEAYGFPLDLSRTQHLDDLVRISVEEIASRARSQIDVSPEINEWIASVSNPSAWTALLSEALSNAALAVTVAPVLTHSRGLLESPDTRRACIDLIRVASPLMTESDHRDLERQVHQLATAWPSGDKRRVWLEEARDQALVVMASEQLRDPASVKRLQELETLGMPSEAAGPTSFTSTVTSVDEGELWADLSGVDKDAVSKTVMEILRRASELTNGNSSPSDTWASLADVIALAGSQTEQVQVVEHARYLAASHAANLSKIADCNESQSRYLAKVAVALLGGDDLPPWME